MNVILRGIFLLITLTALGCNQTDPVEQLKKHANYLAGDELEGRETGTEGEGKAINYISNQFQDLGLKPAGTEGYLQTFWSAPASNPHEKPKTSEKDTLGTKVTNVIGLMDNSGDGIIILGAHHDHLGVGGFGSLHRGDTAVHNGADDNASGVSVLLELARALKMKGVEDDVLFITFSGEEKGLWGSSYFAKNPTIDLSKVKAMINMDMVGRLNEEKSLAVHGTGTSPVWPGLLEKSNTDSLKLVQKPSGIGPSDHTSFYLQDIPVLHLFTGQHEDYHKPGDDPDKLNYAGMARIAGLVERIIINLDQEGTVAFTKTKDESKDTPRFTVSLGVVPDYLYNGEGMKIDGVSEGKPAAGAGLQKGDIVIAMGDSTITDMMSYMKALSSFKKGDTTRVKIKRADEEMIFPIKF